MSDKFETFMNKVFEAIREKRQSVGMSQGELASRMGKPQSSIARLEAGGVRDPRISMFFQAGEALNINPAELLSWAYEQANGSPKRDVQNDWRQQKIKNRLELLNDEEKEKVGQLFEGILDLI